VDDFVADRIFGVLKDYFHPALGAAHRFTAPA